MAEKKTKNKETDGNEDGQTHPRVKKKEKEKEQGKKIVV